YVDSHWDEIKLSSLILLQHEIPLETCHYIIKKAHASSIPVMLNPAPFHEIPTDVLTKVDYLVVNEVELQGIVPAQVSSIEDVIRAGKEINQMGVKQVLITLGGDGAVLVSNEEVIHQPAFTVNAVDTTAAGDTFVGYFASAIINGFGLKQALVNSCGAAALAVTKVGAQSSIPCNDDTQSFVQKYTTEGVR
ncbi:MAG TPA: PfkB family carbohydrate kinase, partial [Anaerolineaceae bacterium]|nr:PfkB family carbohydrate kinase [Anaerolineaceae bacterium]